MRTFPDYTVVRELGKGATATVYLAVQKSLNRRVALKVLGGGLAADPTFTQRFLREGRIIAKLNHPNIVPVYDVGDHAGTLFMAMEYLEGGSLDARRTELTLEGLATCFGQITGALDYAHRQGFVHRDIKLDNILFRKNGDAVLGDFGIARATESLTRMTMTGAILGTPAYMSPEQVAGRELDSRADIYSLGVVLFELLSGYAPFQGDSVMSVGLQHITAPVPALPAAASHFQPLIDCAMAKKPNDRYSGAAAFNDALSERLASFARPADTPLDALHGDAAPQALDIDRALSVTGQEPAKRSWLFVGVAAVAAVAAMAVTAVINTQDTGPETEAAPVTEVQEPVDPELQRAQAEINALLQQADEADRQSRWLSDGDGAADLFGTVLERDSQNATAIAGLQRVRRSALQQVELDILAGRFEQAETTLDQFEPYWPDDETAAALKSDIETRRTSLAEVSAREERDRRLAEVLVRASSAARRGDWLQPEEENAFSLYRAALSIDPENAIGLAGIDSVSIHFITEAEKAIASENLDRAAELLATAASVDSNHARLAPATQRLAAARDAAAERQRSEQAASRFNAQVENLSRRIDDFINAPTDAEGSDYESLSAELSALAAREPDNLAVQALRNALDRHQESLSLEDETDGERFDLPLF